jgi:hypothetical protein
MKRLLWAMPHHVKLTAREGNGIRGEGRDMSSGLEILDEIQRMMREWVLRVALEGPPQPPDDWATSTDLLAILRCFMNAFVSRRKRRLFACACCRLLEPLLSDPRSRQAIETAEQFAEELRTHVELRDARLEAFYAARETRGADDIHHAARAAQFAVAEDIDLAVEEVIRCTILALWPTRRDEVQAMQCDIIRDLLGDPRRVVRCDAAWRTWNYGTVMKIATTIEAERRFAEMPILADALEEAGCTDREILDHCRVATPHVRGCWVLDHLLGKT